MSNRRGFLGKLAALAGAAALTPSVAAAEPKTTPELPLACPRCGSLTGTSCRIFDGWIDQRVRDPKTGRFRRVSFRQLTLACSDCAQLVEDDVQAIRAKTLEIKLRLMGEEP